MNPFSFFLNDDLIPHDLPMYRGKLRFLTIAVAIGVVIAVVIAAWELHLGNYTRALADFSFPLTAPILVYILWRHPRFSSLVLQIFALSIFIQQSSVSLYLNDIKQMIWIPTFPLVYFYLLGQKGWTWSLLLFVELWLVYAFYPAFGLHEVIDKDAMHNFMAGYLMTALLSWMYTREILFYQHSISRRAHYDYLTNICNRVAWLDRLNQEIAIYKRNHREAISVIMFDVDNFKRVNDELGHPIGDKVLVSLTEQFSSRLRKSDVLGRWGGEEFVILLPNTDLSQAHIVAEELRIQLEQNPQDGVIVTASFGVTQYRATDDVEGLLQRADECLYQAKSKGKNCIIAV